MKSQASVSIAKTEDPYGLVEETLELVGVKEKIRKASKIFIKPNLVKVPKESPYAKMEGAYELTFTKGDIVQKETIEALVKVLHEWGASNIAVGEAAGGSDTALVYKALGLEELVKEYGVELVDLNYAEAIRVPIKNGLLLDHLWVPKILLDSDYRISLAVMKTIEATCITLCLKNWGMGVPPAKYYGLNKAQAEFRKGLESPLPIHNSKSPKIDGQEIDVSKEIVDVCSAIGYHLGIIDGFLVQHYKVPSKNYFSPQKAERKNLMIASSNMVAVDVVGTRVLGFDPDRILHIKWAAEKGLGTAKMSEIEIRGKKISEVEMRCNAMINQKDLMLPPIT